MSVKYLGHVISDGKLSPNPEKIKAVVNARKPNNIKELKTYLGLVNYYGKFIPNLSVELHPLYALKKMLNTFGVKNVKMHLSIVKVLLQVKVYWNCMIQASK